MLSTLGWLHEPEEPEGSWKPEHDFEAVRIEKTCALW